MARAVSTTEAKNKLTELIAWVREQQDEVIVERHGEPRAVIMSFDAYERLAALKEQQRRRDALDRLRKLQSEVSNRNQDLTEAQALELADRFVREVIDEMAAEGKITFERDQR
jgi:prevent-host-death family protein